MRLMIECYYRNRYNSPVYVQPTPKPYANITPVSRYQTNPEHGMNPQGGKPVPVLGPQPPLPGELRPRYQYDIPNLVKFKRKLR